MKFMKKLVFPCLALILLLSSCKDEEDKKSYLTFDLYSPELDITKTIWLYLPADYQTTEKEYPVVYFQDAQWVFEKPEGYTQEMHVDENLRALEKEGFEGVIVVGIQSNEETRADEFSLYANPSLRAGGKGQQYLDFMVRTLKPNIDSLYRTKKDRSNTAIMGASLGGLAAFYGLTQYPEVFGKAALFSAALHFNADSVFSKASHKLVMEDTRIFGVVGKNELNSEVNFPADNETLFKALSKYIPSENVNFTIHEDGEHKIWFWEREFPSAVLFLF